MTRPGAFFVTLKCDVMSAHSSLRGQIPKISIVLLFKFSFSIILSAFQNDKEQDIPNNNNFASSLYAYVCETWSLTSGQERKLQFMIS
jgi:hypothetical protein